MDGRTRNARINASRQSDHQGGLGCLGYTYRGTVSGSAYPFQAPEVIFCPHHVALSDRVVTCRCSRQQFKRRSCSRRYPVATNCSIKNKSPTRCGSRFGVRSSTWRPCSQRNFHVCDIHVLVTITPNVVGLLSNHDTLVSISTLCVVRCLLLSGSR